jgi:putative PEP-CTERM system histidine kinase
MYEDIDVLRTGGREVAGHLAQYYLAQRLAEAKQFEDFGRMATFLVHDLSNISTQQGLILQNEERHRHNPEFIADAMRTIARSVDRINRLVALVRSGLGRSEPAVVDAAALVKEAVHLCAGHSPPLAVSLPEAPLLIMVDADQLTHALAHLLRNSQQAVSAAGGVAVSLEREGDYALIKVSDDGSGMSADFVQERLFRPFDSTKNGTGLGIGAFQIREAVKAAGGTLGVQTVEGVGSVFSIRIPLHETRTLSASVAGG